MNEELFTVLWGILKRLSEDCEKAIQPGQCILESTRQGSAYHFRVPNRSRRQIVAWGHLRPGGSTVLGISKPCVTVGVYAGSLEIKQPPFSSYYHPNANWGPKGLGEVQAAICEADDTNYRLILKALIQASKAVK